MSVLGCSDRHPLCHKRMCGMCSAGTAIANICGACAAYMYRDPALYLKPQS